MLCLSLTCSSTRMMSSRMFAGFGRLKVKLLAAAAVGSPPRVDNFAAVV